MNICFFINIRWDDVYHMPRALASRDTYCYLLLKITAPDAMEDNTFHNFMLHPEIS